MDVHRSSECCVLILHDHEIIFPALVHGWERTMPEQTCRIVKNTRMRHTYRTEKYTLSFAYSWFRRNTDREKEANTGLVMYEHSNVTEFFYTRRRTWNVSKQSGPGSSIRTIWTFSKVKFDLNHSNHFRTKIRHISFKVLPGHVRTQRGYVSLYFRIAELPFSFCFSDLILNTSSKA